LFRLGEKANPSHEQQWLRAYDPGKIDAGEGLPKGAAVAPNERDLRKAELAHWFVRPALKPLLSRCELAERQIKAPSAVKQKISHHFGEAAQRLFNSDQFALHLCEIAFQPVLVGGQELQPSQRVRMSDIRIL